MNLHILQYNNYYNRQVKREPTLNDYREYEIYVQAGANFYENDGVNTVQVIGAFPPYMGNGDYLIVEQDNRIISRWFIIENKKTRSGQYELTLRRDLVVDFYEDVIAAPLFVEKAMVSNINDPAIFNKETMTFNQIKRNEVLLKDKSQSPWIVGYYLPQNAEGITEMSVQVTNNAPAQYEEVSSIGEWDYYGYTNQPLKYATKRTIAFWADDSLPRGVSPGVVQCAEYGFTFDESDNVIGNTYAAGTYYTAPFDTYTQPTQLVIPVNYTANKRNGDSLAANVITENRTQICGYLNSLLGTSTDGGLRNILEGKNGRYIKDASTGTFYQISVQTATNSYANPAIVNPQYNSGSYIYFRDLWAEMGEWVNEAFGTNPALQTSTGFRCSVDEEIEIRLVLTELDIETFNLSIPLTGSEVKSVRNAPYNIFCMPYKNGFNTERTDGGITSVSSIDINMSIVSALIEKYSGNNGILLDVQLLPFCPSLDIIHNLAANGNLLIDNLPETAYRQIVNNDGIVSAYVYFCDSSTVETILNYPVKLAANVETYKVSNECDMYRLVSPNWNGQFEFSAAKNYGVDYFNVDLELRPYNPYIHVAPNFKGLYRNRTNDPIGLICNGDFGLTMVSDAWAAYERQNKNYQQMFDRQIQNLEMTQDIQRKQEIVSTIVGSTQGTLTGAAGGYAVGGPVGAAVGAIGGGLASTAGGIADIYFNEKLRGEALDFTKDQYTAQLGNIKALPDSLSRVSSLNANNRLFVFLEYYTCTDIEKDALKDKIKYNGMTINRIGNIQQFLQSEPTYIKGKLIRLEGVNEDFHLANSIAGELDKGVFI